ncbi:MAG: K(+)-transporting ATPase subunit C [Desulfobacteraceae bacterium]|nr:K(+)-transporting ATPase subunit C [Desulfobacteraceae bacterium]
MKKGKDKDQSMIMDLIAELRTSLVATLLLAVLLCGVYPVVVWGVARGIFLHKANGSLLYHDGRIVGSSLIGQEFKGPGYFHPRPSAAGEGYDAAASGGSNLGPTSQKLIDAVAERISGYRTENGLAENVPVPADAVTASGSGLDPHISIANAALQARRVASVRGLSEAAVHKKIEARTEGRDMGIFGEPRVNVLLLNLDLDGKL